MSTINKKVPSPIIKVSNSNDNDVDLITKED